MKQVNFAVMLGLALLTVYFTLENTSATTVNIVPGVSTSLPLPALLLVAAGIGALGVGCLLVGVECLEKPIF